MAGLPYITSSGNIDKALNGIKAASVPDAVSQDFVKTILKIPGGSGDQMTSYLKKIGFSDGGGKPTELYRKFRNPTTSGQSVAKAIKHAYGALYVRNEFMHELSDEELLGLIVEETGQAHDSNPVKLAFACIKALKQHADFSSPGSASEPEVDTNNTPEFSREVDRADIDVRKLEHSGIGLNLGYTINLNLPATSDPAVFNAIFKRLKENLLRDDDA